MITLYCSVTANNLQNELVLKDKKAIIDTFDELIEHEEINQKSLLPISLTVIEEGAFEGTALSEIDITGNVSEIGERAFADNEELLAVYIPFFEGSIADNAFDESQSVFIITSSGSYVENWAKQHKIPYSILVTITRMVKERAEDIIIPVIHLEQMQIRRIGRCIAEKKEQQTGRPFREIKVSRYKGIAAEHIQSRFFP